MVDLMSLTLLTPQSTAWSKDHDINVHCPCRTLPRIVSVSTAVNTIYCVAEVDKRLGRQSTVAILVIILVLRIYEYSYRVFVCQFLLPMSRGCFDLRA